MADLVVITPSRGRPQQFAELAASIAATAVLDVALLGCIDDDDPDLEAYRAQAHGPLFVLDGARRSLSGWTNTAAWGPLNAPEPPRYLASLGDDHRPRTPGWDRLLVEAIEAMPGPGIAYGNDLFQGAQLPTAWVMSAELVRALGWMMLPSCKHLYVDAAILELGQAAGRIAYRPDVIIEHLHPAAGKGTWDPSYQQSNSPSRYQQDRAAFETWRRDQMADDVAKLLAASAHAAAGR